MKTKPSIPSVWCRRARGILVCAFGRTTCCFPDTTDTQLWRMPFLRFDGLEEREVYFVVWERKLVLRKGGKKRSRSWCRKRRTYSHTQKNGQSQIGNTKNYCVTSSTSSRSDRSYVRKMHTNESDAMQKRHGTDWWKVHCLFVWLFFFCLIRCIYCKPTKGAGNRVESITHDWCEPERACIRGRWIGRGSVCSIGRK